MPKQTNELIPKIYKKTFETIGLFFWVEAQKKILPTITVRESIEKYLHYCGYECDFEVARTTYERMKKEYLNNG